MTTHTLRIYDHYGEIVYSAGFSKLEHARLALVNRGFVFRRRRSNSGWMTYVFELLAVPLGPRFTIPAMRGVIEEL